MYHVFKRFPRTIMCFLFRSFKLPSLNHSPDSTTGRSPSLLPLMGLSNVSVINKAKQKKEECRSEVKEEKCEIHGVEKSNTFKIMQLKLEEQSTTLNQQSLKAGGKVRNMSNVYIYIFFSTTVCIIA